MADLTAISDLHTRALALYKPPFRYECGHIYDVDFNMVADQTAHVMRIRGWGRISYLKDPEKLQDEVGKLVAEALTKFWTENVSSGEEIETQLSKDVQAERLSSTDSMLASLRDKGWVVAVHNDYKLGGVLHTFYLFTKGAFAAKGEGKTDIEALERVLEATEQIDAGNY
jgi:hypothetical protein